MTATCGDRRLNSMKHSPAAAERSWRMLVTTVLLLPILWNSIPGVSAQGSWDLLVENAGIASMHTIVTHYGTILFLDRTNIGPSQIALLNGVCRDNAADLTLTHDCTAHSVELTLGSNNIRPLFIFTDTWCSSGSFSPDGTIVQTGGDFDGQSKIRTFAPCGDGGCDWVETGTALQKPRWYATNQLLADGRQIVVGGRSAPYVEFVPAGGTQARIFPFLQDTTNFEFDNLYPFVHLLPSGDLFVFANQESIIYAVGSGATVKTFPTLPGSPRNYPSAGSSVMLPLQAANGYGTVEVLVCGGAQRGTFTNQDVNAACASDCGRIVVTDPAPAWAIEQMPINRCMGDMILLPDSTTLIINGAARGSQGWGQATDAVLFPVNYNPFAPAGARFDSWTGTGVPRVYHSTANLLPDGRVLVAGSNTHQFYTFTGPFPTELRVEAFSPPYIGSALRPAITDAPGALGYGVDFTVTVALGALPAGDIGLILASSPWSTHSYSMGQRMLNLAVAGPPVAGAGGTYVVSGTSPPNGNLAPSTYYMLFAVNGGVPSEAKWVRVG